MLIIYLAQATHPEVGASLMHASLDVLKVPCATCGHPDASCRCSGCRLVSYCNAACQRLHWRVHKPDCSPPTPPTDPDAWFAAFIADEKAAHSASHKRLVHAAHAGVPDPALLVGVMFLHQTSNPSPRLAAIGLGFVRVALRKGHPAAPFVLGRLHELGAQGLTCDPAAASALYLRGFAASSHLGCALSQYHLTQRGLLPGGEGIVASRERLMALAQHPSLPALATASASSSFLGQVMWRGAECLREEACSESLLGNAALAATLLEGSARVKEAGLAAGHVFLMCAVASSLLRPDLGPTPAPLSSDASDAAQAASLCTAVLATALASPGERSQAHSLLGCLAYRAKDYVLARQCYTSAVQCCTVGGYGGEADEEALLILPDMLFQGQGGGVDKVSAEAVQRLGCDRELPRCLERAAQRALMAQQPVEAALLWQRAAALGSTMAHSIVHGITLAAAVEQLGRQERVLFLDREGRPSEVLQLIHSLAVQCSNCLVLGSVAPLQPGEAERTPCATAAAALLAAAQAAKALDEAVAEAAAHAALAEQPSQSSAVGMGGGGGGDGGTGEATARGQSGEQPNKTLRVPLFVCQRCKGALYCSAECQRLHWRSQHKHTCQSPGSGSM